jgi:hypothetical protein
MPSPQPSHNNIGTEVPKRIQRKRTRGWKMPPNTVSVTRPGKWSNPFRIGGYFMIGDPNGRSGLFAMAWCEAITEIGQRDPRFTKIETKAQAVEFFKKIAEQRSAEFWAPLRGKNLACFCGLDEPCHADVELELANR